MKSRTYTKRGPGRMHAQGKPQRRLAPMHGPGSMMERDGYVTAILELPAPERAAMMLRRHCCTVGELAEFGPFEFQPA
jgi:hypothetical protein